MAIRQKSWSNLNSTRDFPFDEGATLRDDVGGRPPHAAITGLKVLVPETAGKYVYVGAMTVSRLIATVVLMATDDLDQPGVPVLSVAQTLPLVKHRPYVLSAMYPGAGGWLSFGPVEDLSYAGRFSSPRQSLLNPWAARSYQLPPVPDVALLGHPGLTGIVALHGGNDFEIVKECREVPGLPVPDYDPQYCGDDELGTAVREVIVFRLRDKSEEGANVFDVYRGACAGRPESQSCLGPEPIEFLGPVAPDCNGNVTLELRGCAEIASVRQRVLVDDDGEEISREASCGVVINCGLGLVDACTTRDRLPDATGRLPNEYDDLCESISYVSESDGPAAPAESFNFDDVEASLAGDPSLPVDETLTTIGDFTVRMGSFSDDGGVLTAVSGAGRNVAVYEPLDPPTGYYRRVDVRTQLSSVASPPGTLHNSAVIANYRETSPGSGLYEYHVAELDWDGTYSGFKLFRIAKFNGSGWVNLLSRAVPSLTLDHLYDISLEVVPGADLGSADDAWLIARLQGVTDPSIDVTIGPLSVSSYGPADGLFGFATNRSLSEFQTFGIANVTTNPDP